MFKRTLSAGIASLLLGLAHGQTTEKPLPAKTVAAPVETVTKENLDAGESLIFMGKKLWFETRKRLNLTTEEEVKQQVAEEKRVKLRVGGFKIEK